MGCDCKHSKPHTLPAPATGSHYIFSCGGPPELIYKVITTAWPVDAAIRPPILDAGGLLFAEAVRPPEGFVVDAANPCRLRPIWPACPWRMFYQQITDAWALTPFCNLQAELHPTLADCQHCEQRPMA